jgi:hypothetical protein
MMRCNASRAAITSFTELMETLYLSGEEINGVVQLLLEALEQLINHKDLSFNSLILQSTGKPSVKFSLSLSHCHTLQHGLDLISALKCCCQLGTVAGEAKLFRIKKKISELLDVLKGNGTVTAIETWEKELGLGRMMKDKGPGEGYNAEEEHENKRSPISVSNCLQIMYF